MYDFGFDVSSALQSLNQMTTQLAGGAISAATSKSLQKMVYNQQRQLNEDQYNRTLAMMDKQRDWNLEDYDKILHDTSPAAQVQRYREAGLSDAAAAQAAGDITPVQNPTSIGSVSAGAPPAPNYEPLNNFNFDLLGMLHSIAGLRKENVEADIAEQTRNADISAILDRDEAQRWSLMSMQEDLRYVLETHPYSARSLKYYADADSFLPRERELANQMADINLQSAREKYKWLADMQKAEFDKMQHEIENLVKEYEKTQQDIKTGKAQEEYFNAQTGLVNQQTQTEKEHTRNMSIKNLADGIDAVIKKYGNPSDPNLRAGALIEDGILQPESVNRYFQYSRDYVLTGRDVFSGDTDLRNIFINDIAPGVGKTRSQPLWNIGTFDNLYQRFKQPVKGVYDYNTNGRYNHRMRQYSR